MKVFVVIRPATLLKRDSNTGVFPVNDAKFSRTAFFIEHLQWLLRFIKARAD